MVLSNRSLVTIDDLSNGEMEGIFSFADDISASMEDYYGLCRGKVMATLFFEPSTRTRLSFETAMHRLGGSVINVMDVKATSLTKGESIADMARVVGSYADIIVIRHPWEGVAQVIADYAGVPVINAGDGGHQHPTQTLSDLYTLRRQRNTLEGLKIALWGDLKYGRTTHSLIFALAKFGAEMFFFPSPGLEVPEHVLEKLVAEYGGNLQHIKHSGGEENSQSLPLEAVYTTPDSPHQLAILPGINADMALQKGVDALYVTRIQKERFSDSDKDNQNYPVVNKKLMEEQEFRHTLVMHPLPRVDELAYDLDEDPRSMYFKQAAWGVPVRMALVALLLGVKNIPMPAKDPYAGPEAYPLYRQITGVKCPNPRCVSMQESEQKYIIPEFRIVKRNPLTLRCVYCEHGFEPRYAASMAARNEPEEKRLYYPAASEIALQIPEEDLLIFNSTTDAESWGFKPSFQVKQP